MKIYGAALAREPRKSSPFCDCLNKAKIPFQSADGIRRILCALPLVPAGMRGTKRPEKTERNAFIKKILSPAPDKFRKSRWQKTRLARNCRGASFAAGCRGGEETGKAELHGGIPPRVEDINRRLPVTGQGKMEFLLRICLCYVPGVTRVRRLV